MHFRAAYTLSGPYWQGGCLACRRLQGRFRFTLYTRCSWVLPMRAQDATSPFYLPSLTPLSSFRTPLSYRFWQHCPTDAAYFSRLLQAVDYYPIFCGSRFSTRRILAIEDFIFYIFPELFSKAWYCEKVLSSILFRHYMRRVGHTSVYLCPSSLQNLSVPQDSNYLSQYPRGVILVTMYSMVWEWRDLIQGPMLFLFA